RSWRVVAVPFRGPGGQPSSCFTNPDRCVKRIRDSSLTAARCARHICGMVAPLENRQRIARLTPLEDVMRWIAERIHPVTPRDMAGLAALGPTLAQDVAVGHPPHAAPLALIDGWAVCAEATADAGSYAPVILSNPREVAVGEALSGDGDVVAPLDSVVWRGEKCEMHVAMTPGEG